MGCEENLRTSPNPEYPDTLVRKHAQGAPIHRPPSAGTPSSDRQLTGWDPYVCIRKDPFLQSVRYEII